MSKKMYQGHFKLTLFDKDGEIDQTTHFPPDAGKLIGAVSLFGGTEVKLIFEPITEEEYIAHGLEKYGVPEAE